MPELPEVQSVRQTLAKSLPGKSITNLTVNRPDILTPKTPTPLLGHTFTTLHRHGKQLALLTKPPKHTHPDTPTCLCVHLGMTGSLQHHHAPTPNTHQHIIWYLSDNSQLVFRDPRRFGGLWLFTSLKQLQQTRWAALGPDALNIQPRHLHQRLNKTTRPLKAALLDQSLIAGLGNIYVDELLFSVHLNPHTPANHLSLKHTQHLVRNMRKILNHAITAGGSTLRDYVNANGKTGNFQSHHQVYGQAKKPCPRCQNLLDLSTISGRSTTFCPICQQQPPPQGHG